MVSVTKAPNKDKTKLHTNKVKKIRKPHKDKPSQKIDVVKQPSKQEPWKITAEKLKMESELLSQNYVMPSSSITGKTVTTCLNAIEKLFEHYKKGNKLFEDETAIFLEIHCIKIQSTKGNISW